MADMDKIKVDELQDVTGGRDNTEVSSVTELDSLTMKSRGTALYFAIWHYLFLSKLSISIIEREIHKMR